MKITDVETLYLRLPNLDDTKCDGTQDTLVVRVHTDEGITGLGEVDSSPIVARAVVDAPASHSIAVGLRELLVGEDPLQVEKLWQKMYQGTIYFGRSGAALHAISGVDIALWDIVGKATNRSVSDAIGGTFHARLKAYASMLMPDSAVQAARLAERYAAQGYRAMKFGWGPIGKSPALDEECVAAIRSAIGNDIDIMIDAGLAWDLKQALKMVDIYEKYGVLWLEEPLVPDDLEGYRELSARANLYIAAGEQESGRLSFQRLIDNGKVDIVQPDLGRCGGITEARKIASFAFDRHKRVVPHCFKSGILVSATAQFVASLSDGWMVEYTVSESPLARNLVDAPITFHNGFLTLCLDNPGLGVQLNQAVVDKYRVN